jgi:Reverse transcriptase (RNA-dependent DNA polymerase)
LSEWVGFCPPTLYVKTCSALRPSLPQVTCLTLRDLSAAFDTIDHSVLLERLAAWFGITSTTSTLIKSCLLNRSFYVNVENIKFSVFQLLYGVSRGSVLGSLLFILYYPPLHSVLSYLIHLQIIVSMRMIFNWSNHSLLLSLHTISLISIVLYLMSKTGCHLPFFLSIPLRLSFFLLVILNYSQN